MRSSDWSSDVCSSDLFAHERDVAARIYSGQEKGHRRIGIKRCRGKRAAVHTEVECGAVSNLAPAHAVRMEDTLGGSCGARGIDYVEDVVLLRLERSDLGAVMRHEFVQRSEEHTSELQSLMRISYAVFCLKKQINTNTADSQHIHITPLHIT